MAGTSAGLILEQRRLSDSSWAQTELLMFQVYQVQIQENLERRNFSDTDELCCEAKHSNLEVTVLGRWVDSSGVSAHCLGSQDYILCCCCIFPTSLFNDISYLRVVSIRNSLFVGAFHCSTSSFRFLFLCLVPLR